jgi:hypothetical protein
VQPSAPAMTLGVATGWPAGAPAAGGPRLSQDVVSSRPAVTVTGPSASRTQTRPRAHPQVPGLAAAAFRMVHLHPATGPVTRLIERSQPAGRPRSGLALTCIRAAGAATARYPPLWRQGSVDRHALRAAPERPFCCAGDHSWLFCVRHEAHCYIARVAGIDWRRCLWI